MKKYILQIQKTILKNAGNEGPSNDLSVLLRVLSIFCIFHFLFLIFPIAYISNLYMTIFLIFGIGIMLGVIICTYENRTPAGLWLYNGFFLLYASLMSIFIGWEYFFVPMIFSTILLAFFALSLSLRIRLFYTSFCCVLTLILANSHYFLPLHTTPPLKIQIAILTLSTLLMFGTFTVISYAFYLKYSKSEEKIMQYTNRLEQMANTDALTTLWNRRAMNEHLMTLSKNFDKHKADFSVVILDIDFFKKVNDEYGHGMGDFVLKSLSYLFKTYMDGKGHVARWGGEEFLLTFENMDYDRAISYMETLRKRVEDQEFTFRDTTIRITITAGIEDYHSNIGLDQLLTKADEKLYLGKTSGRNRVVSAYTSV